MNILRYTFSFLILIVVIPCTSLLAQNQISLNPKSTMFIHGTSTIHDWTSEVEDLTGSASINFQTGALDAIGSLNLKARVESIESGKSKMNSLTYEALKSQEHPFITFKLSKVETINDGKITAKGNVNIAGVEKYIEVKGSYITEGDDLVIFGVRKINMRNFDIEPPTAMFGTIEVGEEIEIEFNLRFKIK